MLSANERALHLLLSSEAAVDQGNLIDEFSNCFQVLSWTDSDGRFLSPATYHVTMITLFPSQ